MDCLEPAVQPFTRWELRVDRVPDDQRLAAEVETRNLLARVQHMVDMGELDDYMELFTDDAVWVQPGDPQRGRAGDERRGHADIRLGVEQRRAAGIQGPGTNTRHVSTTVSVQMDGADAASATSYFQYYTNTTTAPTLSVMGYYRHTLRRTTEGWKVARREIVYG
jgi:3-phenylpropionate/cinnamic acid dioxygenase small subunit